MASKLTQPIKEFFAHHRKFTPFQKVLICSIFVGVLLCILRSWWYLLVACTYTVTVYASVTATKYILTCTTYFPSDVILALCENIADFSRNLIYGFQERHFLLKKKDVNGESSDLQMHTNERDEDKFYDTNDPTELPGSSKTERTALYCQRTAIYTPIDENEISTEINSIIKLIQQDFVESWYKLFSKEQSVLKESEIIFHHIVHALLGRLHKKDTKKLFEFILLMFKDHVHFVKEAQGIFKVQSKIRRRRNSAKSSTQGESIQTSPPKLKVVYKSVEECYGSKVDLHLAVTNTEIEHAYQKSIIELLLVHLLREDLHDTATLVCALKEILTFNVLQKVMDLISSTTFLHERIIKITSDEEICAGVESIPTITVSETETLTNNVQSILIQSKTAKSKGETVLQTDYELSEKSPQTEMTPDQKVEESYHTDSHVVKWKEDTEIHTVSAGLCNECNRLCSTDKERISPRPHTCSLGTTPTFFDVNIDPDRVSLHSFASVSSTSSKESATFCVGEQEDTDNSLQTGSQAKDTDSVDEVEKNTVIRSKNHSPTKSSAPEKTIYMPASAEEPAGGKSLESPSHLENKSSANIFPSLTLKFPFANPLPSLPNFRKPSFKSLSPTTEIVSTSSAGTEQSKSDIKRSLSQGDVIQMSDENPWPLNAPSVFQKVKISSTEAAKEVGSFGEYTLYSVEYEALYQSDNGELVNKTGIVRRRFREFVNLQSRLEDNPVYKKSLKDVKGPKRILPSLPFGNMGKDTVGSRKELLETFLVALIKKEDICNGEELKQFLGYSGDGHIAFVRKPPENVGPRIDQRLVKTMSGVFDKIVEGLPSLPQQLPRIISPFEQREEKDDSTDDKLTYDADDINLIFEHDVDKVSKQKVESTFEKFVEQQSFSLLDDDVLIDTTLGTSVLTWQDQQIQGTSSSHMTSTRNMIDEPGHMTQTAKNQGHTNALSYLNSTDNPLSDAVLCILTEALQRQDHWVCRENVVKAAKVLFGKGLNRFVEEKVDFLTSTEMNVFYLKTLRETIWPHGELSTDQASHYTDLQKEQIKQQATRCLAEFLPGILAVILGAEEYDEALEEIMEALNYEKLNRHFWYTVFDVVLEELFPEVNTQELQRKLSAAVQFQ